MVFSVRQKNVFFQHVSQPFLKMRKFLLDMRKDFLILSNFYLVEILSQPNSLTIATSKKMLKMSNYVLILSIFFLITRNRNLQCKISCCFNDCFYGRRLENDSNKRKFGLSSGRLISIQILPNRC